MGGRREGGAEVVDPSRGGGVASYVCRGCFETSQECGGKYLFRTTRDILLFQYAVKLEGAVCTADTCSDSMRFVIKSSIRQNHFTNLASRSIAGEQGGRGIY